MKKYLNPIFILFTILLVSCVFSFFMKFHVPFTQFSMEGAQEPLTIDLDPSTFEQITNDIFSIQDKYDDSKGNYVIPKPVIDTIIDNIRAISKGSTEKLKTIPN